MQDTQTPETEALSSLADLDRRNFIRSAIFILGAAGTAFPGWNAIEAATRGKVRFFPPAQFAVLDAVAETIMPRTDTPGARDALVPARFDALMLHWASAKTKADFTRVLSEIDLATKGIAALPPAKQLEVVAAYDRAKMADPAYRKFKGLILSLYYISEPGATQELRYEHAPGVWEPSIAVTADTRAYALDVSFGG